MSFCLIPYLPRTFILHIKFTWAYLLGASQHSPCWCALCLHLLRRLFIPLLSFDYLKLEELCHYFILCGFRAFDSHPSLGEKLWQDLTIYYFVSFCPLLSIYFLRHNSTFISFLVLKENLVDSFCGIQFLGYYNYFPCQIKDFCYTVSSTTFFFTVGNLPQLMGLLLSR